MLMKNSEQDVIAAQREHYQADLDRAVQTIVVALARRPEVERAFLFGSYARGRRDLFTDLDLLIVMNSPLDFVTRVADMYQYLAGSDNAPIGVDIDLLVYTPEEFQRNASRGFIRRALEEGELIYEKKTT